MAGSQGQIEISGYVGAIVLGLALLGMIYLLVGFNMLLRGLA